ncbi:MAG: response regulator [Spirochaetales bacterium]|nr:response regulator [Spirochaetales bacterium]
MKIFKQLRSYKSPLTIHFLVYILVVSFLFIGLSSAVQIFRAYDMSTKEKNDRLDFIENQFTASLSESLYNLDEPMTHVQMESILQLKSIARVEITEFRGKKIVKYTAGSPVQQEEEEFVYTLVYQDGPDGPILLGKLYVYIDSSSTLHEIQNRILSIIGINLILLFLIISSLVILIHRLVTRPLLKIVHFSEAMKLEKLNRELVLDRKRRLFPPDEFDQLQEALNAMNRRLSESLEENEKIQTEKKELEEQYLQTQKMESLGRLAGGIAHDLNNLLTPIIGFSELSMEDTGKEKIYIKEINKAGIRAARLVKKLLVFSRKHDTNNEFLNLNSLIRDFYQLLRASIHENIEIILNLDESLKPVYTDMVHIEQILMNLAVNARDAMPDGGILTISTCQTVAGGEDFVTLKVRDTGTGMSGETANLIFEPFYSTKGESGSGLGLSTVYGLVKQHNGEISVSTKLGEGSCFQIIFPLSKEKEDGKEDDLPTYFDRISSTGRKILLVEDDEQVRELNESILRKWGYSVLSCTRGEDAMKQFDSFNPQILLSDVVMPGMSGPELFRACKEKDPGIKAIFMSGFTRSSLQDNDLKETLFLQKPFTLSQLRTRLNSLDI